MLFKKITFSKNLATLKSRLKKVGGIPLLLCISPIAFPQSDVKLEYIAYSKQWLKLGHYHSYIFGKYKSRVDNAEFFFSKEGKYDPLKELQASIKLFKFNPGKKVGVLKIPAVCAFPARYKFIKDNFSVGRNDISCPNLSHWVESLDPKGASLIFASAYRDNPGSLFGHTFIKVKGGQGQNSKASGLFDYAISFAADTPPQDSSLSITDALKGLLGGYHGIFEVNPFYVKLREYSSGEDRELFEYHLNLSPEQARFMVLHTWELLNNAVFDYYFLDDNCALLIMALLEVANPSWEVSSNHSLFVAPIDTVKDLLKKKDIVVSSDYHPSLKVKVKQTLDALTKREKEDFNEVILNRRKIEEIKNIKVLDGLLAFANHQKNQDIDAFQINFGEKFGKILRQRSKLPHTTSAQTYDESESSPRSAHETSTIGLGKGLLNKNPYIELRTKLLIHDLISADKGFVRNSEVNLFDLKMRYFEKLNSLKLESLTFYSIVALNPLTKHEKGFSWVSRLGIERDGSCFEEFCHSAFLEGGMGASIEAFSSNVLAYGLGILEAKIGEGYKNRYRASLNPRLGLLARLGEQVKAHLHFSILGDYRPNQVRYNQLQLFFETGWTVNKSFDFRLKGKRIQQFDQNFKSTDLSLNTHLFF